GRVTLSYGVGRQPAAFALEPDVLDLVLPRCSGKDATVQFGKGGALLGCNSLHDRATAHRLDVVGLNHRETRRIHVEQPALGIEELHAFGLAFDNRAEPRLAFPERIFCATALGDVEGEPNHSHDGPTAVTERLNARTEDAALEAGFVERGLPPERGAMCRQDGLPILRIDEGADRRAIDGSRQVV